MFCLTAKQRDNSRMTIIEFNFFAIGIALIVYAINKVILTESVTGSVFYFCTCYLNDLVCPLFFLGATQLLLNWAGGIKITYMLGIIFVMLAGCVWEFFAPVINSKATTDWIDLLCYFVGIHLYYILQISLQNRNQKI